MSFSKLEIKCFPEVWLPVLLRVEHDEAGVPTNRHQVHKKDPCRRIYYVRRIASVNDQESLGYFIKGTLNY